MNVRLSILLLLFGSALRGAPTDVPLSLDNRPALEWAINDNPKSLQDWAKREFEAADRDQEPRRWVRALWLHAALATEWRQFPDARNLIEQGVVVAERENMLDELIAFKSFLPGIMEEQAQDTGHELDSKAVIAEYERTIREAKQIGIKRGEAEALASFAFYLRDLGETNRSLQLLLEANQLLLDDPTATELNRMSMKNNLALAYSYQNQEARAKALYKEIESFCNRVRLRSFCLTNDYNLAKLLTDQEDTSELPLARAYFLKSMQLAEEIDDRWSIATAHSGLISYHMKLEEYALALNEADIAIQLFKAIQNNVWLADSYKKGGRALIGAKRYQDAIRYIEQARSLFPEGFRRDLDELNDLLYSAYRGLGDTEKALIYLEKHNIEFKNMAAEREKSDYSRLMVGMGLQIEEEKNKFLSIDNELKSQKLAETERLRLFMLVMLGLSILVMASMGLAVVRSREIKVSRMKMQRILSNIEEGILTINSQMLVESEYSRYLNTLLGTEDDLTGKAALPLLLDQTNLGAEDKSMVHEALHASIGEDELQWFANEQHLPAELIYPTDKQARIVAVHWQPLFDKNGRVQNILIGLIDVTERRKLEAEIVLERQRSDRQGRLIHELAQADSSRVDALLTQANAQQSNLERMEQTDVRAALLRELHTIKGISRSLGLKEMSSQAHELEEQLQTFRDPVHAQELGAIFSNTVQDYLAITQNIFGRKSSAGPLDRRMTDLTQILLPGLIQQLKEHGMELQGLELKDHVIHWTPELLRTTEQILVHALNNSVDHGFIWPHKRGMTVARPILQIEARLREGCMELKVRDNGAGLDLNRLQELARKHNFVPEPGRSVADVVFLDGSTTADKVSRTSGRGLGMAAIRSLCEEWKGEVHLEPNPEGCGAQLIVIFPLAAVAAIA